jgi:hypothetical protein
MKSEMEAFEEMKKKLLNLPPDERKRVEIACTTLKQSLLCDPIVMTIAMALVSGESMIKLVQLKDILDGKNN